MTSPFTEHVSTYLSPRQARELNNLTFRLNVSRRVLVRQAILAMIDYEADALADIAKARMARSA